MRGSDGISPHPAGGAEMADAVHDAEMEDAEMAEAGQRGPFAPPDGPPPPSAPPSPARTEPETHEGGGGEGGSRDEAVEAEAASNAAAAAAAGGWPCFWNGSGLRGVYRAKQPADPSKPWEARLPELVSKGRSGTQDEFTHRSLGFFASAAEAGAAFSVAADAAASAATASGEPPQFLFKNPIAPLLEGGKEEGGGVDMNAVFKEADREDREDGHADDVEIIVSERSVSGYKGVHKTSTQSARWQTQVCPPPASAACASANPGECCGQ